MTRVLVTWAILMALAGASWGAVYLPLAPWLSILVALSIATTKATLVLTEFMELREENATLRIVAITAFLMVGIMLGFMVTDVATRTPQPATAPAVWSAQEGPGVPR